METRLQQLVANKAGLFISIEGIDGSGKSTHVEYIAQCIKDYGFEVVLTREPGGTEGGEKIRQILLESPHLEPNTELLLYFASRQELISKVILPALNRGACVLADRFVDASIAYQGVGRERGVDKVRQVYSFLQPQLKTDLTLLFDVNLAIALERIRGGRKLDRIEQEDDAFFARVQKAYYSLLNKEPERFRLINTQGPKEATQGLIKSVLASFFGS